MAQLERRSKKYDCPSCGAKKKFKRYVDDIGDYIDASCGRCDRESSCGYHLTPKEYYERAGFTCSRREQMSTLNNRNKMNAVNTLNKMNTLNAVNSLNTLNESQPDAIDFSFVVRSLEHTGANRFINFLLSFIPRPQVAAMVKRYFVGGTRDGRTCFWQIDREGRARTGKIISYLEETGKRDKQTHPSWIHYELKRAKVLPESFEHKICFFGEHLLKKEKVKPLAIVEAEKTAAVASLFLDDFHWLAAGGKSYLKAEKLARFRDRKIVLYPDADGYGLWQTEAEIARKSGLNVTVSDFIERRATAQEKAAGFDLADYLIRGELAAQKYNRKLDEVLSTEFAEEYLDELKAERLAVMEKDDLTDADIRAIVMGMKTE